MAKVLPFTGVARTTHLSLPHGGGKVQAYELRALDGLMERLIAAGPEPPCGSPANPHLTSDVALRGGRPYCVNCGWRP